MPLVLYTRIQIENMINEVKYSNFVETGTYVSDIDLDRFIQSKRFLIYVSNYFLVTIDRVLRRNHLLH